MAGGFSRGGSGKLRGPPQNRRFCGERRSGGVSKPRRGRRGAGYGARDNAAPGTGSGSSRHGRYVLINASSPRPSGRGLFPWELGRTQGAPAAPDRCGMYEKMPQALETFEPQRTEKQICARLTPQVKRMIKGGTSHLECPSPFILVRLRIPFTACRNGMQK